MIDEADDSAPRVIFVDANTMTLCIIAEAIISVLDSSHLCLFCRQQCFQLEALLSLAFPILSFV
jgi:hypothetical protein